MIDCTKTIGRNNALTRGKFSLKKKSWYICQTWRSDNLFEIDDVLVVQLLQDFNLADGRDRELRRIQFKRVESRDKYEFYNASHEKGKGNTYALPLVVHSDLLQRHDFLRLRLLRHEDLPRNNSL